MRLILKDADQAAIAPYLSEGSASFEVLRQAASQRSGSDIKSEAGALRALLQAGAEALREHVLETRIRPTGRGIQQRTCPHGAAGGTGPLRAQDRGRSVNRGMRSQTYRVDLGHGPKPWVILSNNSRNRNLDTVLAARITTTSKNAHVPTVVPLNAADTTSPATWLTGTCEHDRCPFSLD